VLIALNGGHPVRPALGPDDTNPNINPIAARDYAIPSCGACLRIAEKRGIRIGDTIDEGRVEAVTHADGQPHALAYNAEGYFIPVSIYLIEDRRRDRR
jgi:hypothetical protein